MPTQKPSLTAKWNGPTSTTTGTGYTGSIQANGGTAPYRFNKASGALPDGLELDPQTGKITGTARVTGTFSFSVKVSDSQSQVATASGSISVAGASAAATPPPATGAERPPTQPKPAGSAATMALSAAWDGPASATVGKAFTGTITAAGGVKPWSFVRSNGALPGGLELDRTSGKITGTPREAGEFSYAVTVADDAGETFLVNCPLTVEM